MRGIEVTAESVRVHGLDRSLTYLPRRITIDDGTFVMHASRGGTLHRVWCTDLGDRFVEVVHLGDGPVGGELILVVPDVDLVALGDLYAPEPTGATLDWAAAIDSVLGMTRPTTTILTSSGPIDRDTLEDFHQHLLGLVHG